ncbi:hypothetical protein CPB84DRAFT_1749638 [Gymnopilus junonius]|uniref:F-box domain-containing protein n=1 Tax=Gymnopilus junonius TaxID=109634 RepID=A0A9P5NI11_GYMJU|nr:hypothetical protein CPB84DRAFT_1749638 [Gymnopilus junonius]
MDESMSLDWSGKHLPSMNGSLEIIHQIPTEVLSMIFLFTTIPSDNASDDLDEVLMSATPVFSRKMKTSPFALSQVCRRWRDIVIDTKAMWRSVAVVNPNERHLYRLQLWMTRVRDHPLEVALFLDEDTVVMPQSCRDMVDRVLQILGQNLHRWSTIEFQSLGYVPSRLCDQFKELSSIDSPILRKAIITFGLLLGTPVEELWGSFQHIQSLETLHYNGDYIYQAARLLNPRIRTFKFAPFSDKKWMVNLSSNRVVSILSPFPNVEELYIGTNIVSYEGPQDDENFPPVVLPHLRALTIKMGDFLHLFCRRFITPSLTSLNIMSGNSHDADNIAYLLWRSACKLEKLVLCVEKDSDRTGWLESETFKSVPYFWINGNQRLRDA